jgi:hypothetical protein
VDQEDEIKNQNVRDHFILTFQLAAGFYPETFRWGSCSLFMARSFYPFNLGVGFSMLFTFSPHIVFNH